MSAKGKTTITIHPAVGNFAGFEKQKTTEFKVNLTTHPPKKVTATVGKSKVKLTQTTSMANYLKAENVYYYDATPNLNKFATPGSEFAKEVITKNPQLLVKLATTDITQNRVVLDVEGFVFAPAEAHRLTMGTLTAPVAQITNENAKAYTLTPTWEKVTNADFYEIEFKEMLYTTIKDTEFLFDALKADTDYSFKIRAVNKEGSSAWSAFTGKTKTNPLEFAIRGIRGQATAKNQGGAGVNRLFDFAEAGDIWHTQYGTTATPFDLIIDLRTVNQLDKFHYLPHSDGANGTLLQGTVHYSMDKNNWTEAKAFEWKKNGDAKESLEGSENIFVVKFKAKRKVIFGLKPQAGVLVDKNLNSILAF